jgi:hypothetical protein
MCGSIFLDQEMEKRMREWLGRGWTKLSDHDQKKFKHGEWNHIKRNFAGTEQEPFTADIPVDLTKGINPFRKQKWDLRVKKHVVYFDK